jgi:hypothetical protein
MNPAPTQPNLLPFCSIRIVIEKIFIRTQNPVFLRAYTNSSSDSVIPSLAAITLIPVSS